MIFDQSLLLSTIVLNDIILYNALYSVLHVAIINQQEDVVPTLLDILPTLPASESPIIDTPNNFKQVYNNYNNCMFNYM